MPLPNYLDKSFNYQKLTKQQLLKIMVDNHIHLNVNLNSKKQDILQLYKENIYGNIDDLKAKHYEHEMRKLVVRKEIDNPFYDNEIEMGSEKKEQKVKEVQKVHINHSPKIESQTEESKDTYKRSANNSKMPYISVKPTETGDFAPSTINNHSVNSNVSTRRKSLNLPNKTRVSSSNIYQSDSAVDFMSRNELIKRKIEKEEKDIIKKEIPDIVKDEKKEIAKKTIDNTNVKKRKSAWMYVFTFFIAGLLVYIKFYCPYCTDYKDIDYFIRNPHKFCINLPDKGSFVNDDIECEKGYSFVTRWYAPDYCKNDVKESPESKVIKYIVTFLRKRNKKYLLGMCNENFYEIDEIVKIYKENTADMSKNEHDEIAEIHIDEYENERLAHQITSQYADVIFCDNRIYSTKDVNFISLIALYYARNAFYKLAIPFLVLLLFFYAIRAIKRRRLANKKMKAKVDVLCKHIYKALMNQKHFYITQRCADDSVKVRNLVDLFECEKNVWNKVMYKVKRNSNVKSKRIDGEECWEWIGPIIDMEKYIENSN